MRNVGDCLSFVCWVVPSFVGGGETIVIERANVVFDVIRDLIILTWLMMVMVRGSLVLHHHQLSRPWFCGGGMPRRMTPTIVNFNYNFPKNKLI